MPTLPADTYLTLGQLNQLFQGLMLDILGYSQYLPAWEAYQQNPQGTSPTNPYYFVRVEWPQGGAPAWGITEDICFIGVTAINDPFSQPRHRIYTEYDADDDVESIGWTAVNAVMFIFYGPNSYDNGMLLLDRIFRQENHDTLAQSNVYLIPSNNFPRRAPENFQGQWWDRTDVILKFNNLVVRNEVRSGIKQATFSLTNSDGDTDTATVNANT